MNSNETPSHCHPRPDFSGSFRYAYQHDIHDADAANHEGHARNRAQQSSHDVRGRRCRLRDFLLIAHAKVVIATGPDVVSLP